MTAIPNAGVRLRPRMLVTVRLSARGQHFRGNVGACLLIVISAMLSSSKEWEVRRMQRPKGIVTRLLEPEPALTDGAR